MLETPENIYETKKNTPSQEETPTYSPARVRAALDANKKSEIQDKFKEGSYTGEQVFDQNKDLFDFLHANYGNDTMFDDKTTKDLNVKIQEYLGTVSGINVYGDFSLRPYVSTTGKKCFELIPAGKVTAGGQEINTKESPIVLAFGEFADEEVIDATSITAQQKELDVEDFYKKLNIGNNRDVIYGGKMPDGKYFAISNNSGQEWFAGEPIIHFADGTSRTLSRPNMYPKNGAYFEDTVLGTIGFTYGSGTIFKEGQKFSFQALKIPQN